MCENGNSKRSKLSRRVGIVGFGQLGQYLTKAVIDRDDLELAFVWNRSHEALKDKVDDKYVLVDLSKFAERSPDLIVEVAHPCISEKYGAEFLKVADYMIGSPTALADSDVEKRLRSAATSHGLYIPSGAFWGGQDIKKMADRGTLQALRVTMRKHPSSFKLHGELKNKNDQVTDKAVTLYDGSVRGLCPLAPHNVNTMAAAAMAGHNLGFDEVNGCLISDPSLTDRHVVEVEAWGPGDIEAGTAFHVHTVRSNPAAIKAVTGSATFASFLSSMLGAHNQGPGTHLC